MESKILFEEQQSFWKNKLLIFLMVMVLLAVLLTGLISIFQLLEKPSLFYLPILLLIFYLSLEKLTSVVTLENIKFGSKYLPFTRNEFDWEEVEKIQMIEHDSWGWGIRFSRTLGIIYNTAGNKGLLITLKNGKKYMLGTQKSEELKKALDTIFPDFVS
jgi:hypothetical protein